MKRHELRENIFQLLFRAEFNEPQDMDEQVDFFFQDEEKSWIDEASKNEIKVKFYKILEKLPDLDKQLNEKTERWNTKRFGKVELTVMRLALYEMLYDDTIPDGVAIDEAVTIAKTYGQESSGAFVNGVLVKFIKKND